MGLFYFRLFLLLEKQKTMKTKILILFLILSKCVIAQVYLDYSVKDIREYLNKEGYAINEGVNKAGVHYIYGSDRHGTLNYFFDASNKCTEQWFYVYYSTYKQTEEYLTSDGGYYKDGQYFYCKSQNIKAYIDEMDGMCGIRYTRK